MLKFVAFLRDDKDQAPRSTYNKFEVVMTFLKAQGIRGLAGKNDWPRFVNTKILRLQARDGDSSMIVNSNAAENLNPADESKLVFNQYGNRYFLSEIWVSGATRGHQLPKTSREMEMARDVAKDFTQRRVEIVASLQ